MPAPLHVLRSVPTGLFCAGEWREAAGGGTFPVTDPATGAPVAEVADATAADATAALDAACAAQAAWAATSGRQRSEILRRAYELMTERREDLAALVTLEMGKPIGESLGEVAYAAEFFRWFSEEAVRFAGEYRDAPAGGARILTLRQPVGPCLLVTPWNFPLAMVTRKVGPALAAGCTTVLKPAEQTPLSALALAAILSEAGAPAGVVNVVPTASPADAVGAVMDDRRLRKLSFTGSTEVGRLLLARSAANLLRTSLELGGNAPFLVLADADVDAAVDGAVLAKMRNMGQSCVAANRFLVHRSVADEFTAGLAERLAKMAVGPGYETGSDVGPLIDDRQRDAVAGLVDDAVGRGAEVLTGGVAGDGPGFFYPPTVLTGAPAEGPINDREIFGPVASIRSFDSDDELIAAANATDYGLVAYVYTRDLGRALSALDGIEAGMVGINRGLVSDAAAPFGGIKQSGLGREGGREGIGEYLATKYGSIATG